jgi:two-component system, NtrC family, response regulator HydG
MRMNQANGRVLVVDDDEDMCELVRDALEQRHYSVVATTRAEDALQQVRNSEFDVIITDVQMDSMSGLALCERVVTNRPDLPVVVITAHGNMEVAISAIRAGAYDFINKPFKMDELSLTIERAIRHKRLHEEVKRLREAVERVKPVANLVGESAGMLRIYELVEQVADSDTSVLITGESGTGKELVARALHERSARRDAPFIAINCAAVPANLLESELFGHVRGAFTDAKRSRQGLFVQATGGTLFLDEIGEMPLEMQAKMLRVLQERRVRPVGGDAEIPFDTRLIAATNRDLDTEVEEKRFREDLFYRINVVNIHVPPLRSRGNDILLLAQHFLERYARRIDKPVVGISSGSARKLLDYDWPGNVRELENSMERAVTLTKLAEITVDDLPEKIRDFQSSSMVISGDNPDEMPTLEEVERRYIRRVLKAVGGNKTHAARVLGLDRRTLYRRLDRLEIETE